MKRYLHIILILLFFLTGHGLGAQELDSLKRKALSTRLDEYLETLKPLSEKNTKIYDYLVNNTYAGKQNKDVMYKMLKGLTDYRKEIGKTTLSHKDIEDYINKKSVIKGYARDFRNKVIELLKKETKEL